MPSRLPGRLRLGRQEEIISYSIPGKDQNQSFSKKFVFIDLVLAVDCAAFLLPHNFYMLPRNRGQ